MCLVCQETVAAGVVAGFAGWQYYRVQIENFLRKVLTLKIQRSKV